MHTIKILDNDLIGKIAAGEVVERPASVVKELVENAIDAKAKEIIIEIEDGGKGRISIADDGCGMVPADARLSVLRHATSKLSSADDLFNISTMGFRGEALPSIAAVSRMTIETKTAAGATSATGIAGFKLVIEGGTVSEAADFGCPIGTRVVARDLFFNTPARKKFLRGEKTEEGHVADVVSRLALAFPEIRFKLTSGGKEKLSCLSVNDPVQRLKEVFSQTVAENAISFEEGGDGIRIRGFLGSPRVAGATFQGIYLFVNRRFVRDRTVSHAIVDGYRGLLPGGVSPFAVVFLEIDPKRVDVNVHPTKQEVRFDNVGAIHNFVAMAVRKNAQGKNERHCEPFDIVKGEAISRNQPQYHHQTETYLPASCHPHSICHPRPRLKHSGELVSSASLFSSLKELRPFDDISFSSLRVIGQLKGSFIICEKAGGGMIVIDQHAAHERIGFERLKAQLSENGIERQQLLLPEQVEMGPREAAAVSDRLEMLEKLGLEVDPFGGKSFVVKSVPAIISGANPAALVARLAHELSELSASAATEEVTERILKTIACHRQVRAGQTLSQAEMESLLAEMDSYPNTSYCPHGRPTFREFSREEVEKWFGR